MAAEYWDKHGQIIGQEPAVMVIDDSDGSGHGGAGGGGSIVINNNNNNNDTFCWSVPPFLLKLYDMLENGETNSVVSWSGGGSSFVISDPHLFAVDVLPLYFRHRIFHNFITQLNSYGFKKVSWERWEYRNENFRKGERGLLRNIKRRTSSTKQLNRPPSSPNINPPEANSVNSSSSSNADKEVELMLKEHHLLNEEITRLRQKQNTLENRLASLSKSNEDHHNRIIPVLGQLIIEDPITMDPDAIETLLNENISKGKRKLDEIQSESATIGVGSEHLMNWEIDEEEMGEHQHNTFISLKDLIGESSDSFQQFMREQMQDMKPKTPSPT